MLWPAPILSVKKHRAAHQDGDEEAGDEAEGEDGFLHAKPLDVNLDLSRSASEDESRCAVTASPVVILSDDFA